MENEENALFTVIYDNQFEITNTDIINCGPKVIQFTNCNVNIDDLVVKYAPDPDAEELEPITKQGITF